MYAILIVYVCAYLPEYMFRLMFMGGGGLSMVRSLVARDRAPTLDREVVER